MHALLAHDGSRPADEAVDLAASLPWPNGTRLRVVRVARAASGVAAERDRDDLRRVTARLAAPDRTVRSTLVTGRPASVLVRLATEVHADLLIVGSRGFSSLRTLLLGSVSAELVERAPCSVIVARGSGHHTLVVGTDGSREATAMPQVICGWGLFREARAVVVGVAEDVAPGDDPTADRRLALATRRLSARLAMCEISTMDRVLAGEAASVLIEVARQERADLLVIGPRGRSRVTDLLLGGVARKVSQQAPGSVVVVRAVPAHCGSRSQPTA
jgi:nucleotide-binding universal stress UspA family protein